MEITIQSLHFTSREELNDFVTEKVNKLEHLNDKIGFAKVCLKLDKSNHRDNKVCEIQLGIPGNDLFAKRQCETFEKAISEAVDALKNQITKHIKDPTH
jgi:putative sigma-54 modulation protein